MTDLRELHEALQEREQEVAGVAASKAVSQQREEDLKQVTAGSCFAPQTCYRARNINRCTAYCQYQWLRAVGLLARKAARHDLKSKARCSTLM